MIQMTTPTHRFGLPFSVDKIAEVRITYAQDDRIILTKQKADCVLEDQMITVTLSQADTKKFTANNNVQIQLNILTTDQKRLASRKFSVICEDNLDDGVM